MFTDRFIKVPIEVYNKKEAEITGNEEDATFETYIKINPMEILSYRTLFNDEQEEEDKTVVDFKNDTEMIVLMSINEFENLLNHFYAI